MDKFGQSVAEMDRRSWALYGVTFDEYKKNRLQSRRTVVRLELQENIPATTVDKEPMTGGMYSAKVDLWTNSGVQV